MASWSLMSVFQVVQDSQHEETSACRLKSPLGPGSMSLDSSEGVSSWWGYFPRNQGLHLYMAIACVLRDYSKSGVSLHQRRVL